MDRYLAGIVLFVLTLCSLFLLDDLKIISLPFTLNSKQERRELVGRVSFLHNRVKRRSADEFLWTSTQTNEDVYFYDSILTLSESKVTLDLQGKSKIDLSENTLIVIEPSQNNKSNELRLKFKRGSLNTHDLGEPTQIQAGNWELKLEEGTDFLLRSSNNETFELEVQKGSAQITSSGTENVLEKTITSKEIIILKPTSAEKIEISKNLDWENPAFRRIYTREDKTPVPLNWNGRASTLLHTQKSNTESAFELTDMQRSQKLDLEPGTHFFRLKDEDVTSKLSIVEVNRAPTIHLYAPLPRDRTDQSKSFIFSWKPISQLARYRLEIAKDPEFKSIYKHFETTHNYLEYKAEDIGRYYWHVVGIDKDGFEVTPTYSNEIIFVKDPLSAPEIESPIREPAEENNDEETAYLLPKSFFLYSFINLFLSVAYAEDAVILFEWKPVSGAANYSLEIDDDPYFQSPEVITTTKNVFYQWTRSAKGIYFWRVAGNSGQGHYGLFSSVQKTDLSKIKSQKKRGKDFEVYIKNLEAEKSGDIPPSASQVSEAVSENHSGIINATPPVTNYTGYFAYGAGYGHYLMKTDELEQVTVAGPEAARFTFDMNFHYQRYSIKFKGDGSFNTWKDPDRKYPFQEEQQTFTGSASVLYTPHARELWTGLRVAQIFAPYRLGLESFELRSVYLLGPTLQWDTHLGTLWLNQLSTSLLFGEGARVLEVGNTVRRNFSLSDNTSLSLGLASNLNFSSLEESKSLSYAAQVLLLIGFEW